jgi:hypothetical protein
VWDRRGRGRGGSIISIRMRGRESKLWRERGLYIVISFFRVVYLYLLRTIHTLRSRSGAFKCCMYELTTLLILRIWLFYRAELFFTDNTDVVDWLVYSHLQNGWRFATNKTNPIVGFSQCPKQGVWGLGAELSCQNDGSNSGTVAQIMAS